MPDVKPNSYGRDPDGQERGHFIDDSGREFLFTYRFRGAEWGFTIFADNPEEAREKIKAVALARYDGEIGMKIPAGVPGASWLARFICWRRNLRTRS